MPNPYPLLYRMRMTPWEQNADQGPLPDLLARPRGRALDAGCGTGRHAVAMAEHGWTVVGVDGVERPLRMARERAAHAGVADRATFVKADVTKLDAASVDGTFDLVLDIGCLHGLKSSEQFAFADWVTRHTTDGSAVVIHAAAPRAGLGPKGLDEAAVAGMFPRPWSVTPTPSTTQGGGPLRGACFSWYTLER